MFKEFQAFIMRGNVLDLAVGVIIGGAFGKIVDSLVNDLIMPVISLIIGGIDFSGLYIPLKGQAAGLSITAAKEAGAVLAYGNFISIVINFVILAFVIFMLVRTANSLMKQPAPAPAPEPAPPADQQLLTEIRDLLAKGR
jgi:large conductance mechanosensitive channel